MTESTVYKVKVTSEDKSSSLDMDKVLYDILLTYTQPLEFTQSDGKVVIKIEEANNTYLFSTTQEVADILAGDYSIEIVEDLA
jgi:hypothetical protein